LLAIRVGVILPATVEFISDVIIHKRFPNSRTSRPFIMITLIVNLAGLGLIGLIVWWFWIARA